MDPRGDGSVTQGLPSLKPQIEFVLLHSEGSDFRGEVVQYRGPRGIMQGGAHLRPSGPQAGNVRTQIPERQSELGGFAVRASNAILDADQCAEEKYKEEEERRGRK